MTTGRGDPHDRHPVAFARYSGVRMPANPRLRISRARKPGREKNALLAARLRVSDGRTSVCECESDCPISDR